MGKFGQEQSNLEPDVLRRITFRTIGNPHAGARLRLRSLLQALTYLEESYGFTLHAGHMLDAGSGKGEYSFFLLQRFPGLMVTGYDIDEKKVVRARAIAACLTLDDRVSFCHGDFLTGDLKDAFHLALCIDVLEHIENDQAALNCLYQALKPGGFLIIHVPNLVRPHFDVEEDGHVREGYSNEGMTTLIQQAGFDLVQIRNPIGFFGQWADDLCEVLARSPIVRGLGIPLYSGLVWLDQFGSLERHYPHGAGLLAIVRKPFQ